MDSINCIGALKIFLLVMFFPCFSMAQTTDQIYPPDSAAKSFINAKINYNYKNCILIIKANKWLKNSEKSYLPVLVTMTNNSDDTLKYESMFCYEGIFVCRVDNKGLEIEGQSFDCWRNWPVTKVILPHQSNKYNVVLNKKVGIDNHAEKFRLGFYLTLVKGEAMDYLLNQMFMSDKALLRQIERAHKKRTHKIWSNSLTI